jgi:heme exporter protein A
MIEVRKLSKSYGPTGVLRGLDLDAPSGEALVLLGPNGAGKTTLLRILATLTRPDFGAITVNGIDATKQGELVRQNIGVVMHSPMLYGDLTVEENLVFFARMFRIAEPGPRIRELLERVEMNRRSESRLRDLSHGQQKRVALARALLHSPRTLLLDEPESGLDQRAVAILSGIVNEFRKPGRSVVMTTHRLELGLEVADSVAVIERGRVTLHEPASGVDVAQLQRHLGEHVVETVGTM